MLIPLMALFAVLLLVAGAVVCVLRRRGKYGHFSREERETAEALDKAFGKNMRWGSAGGTEHELHDQAGLGVHAIDSDGGDGTD